MLSTNAVSAVLFSPWKVIVWLPAVTLNAAVVQVA
jgi:hypothetical protein